MSALIGRRFGKGVEYSHHVDAFDFYCWQQGEEAHREAGKDPSSNKEDVLFYERHAVEEGPNRSDKVANGIDFTMEVGLDLIIVLALQLAWRISA